MNKKPLRLRFSIGLSMLYNLCMVKIGFAERDYVEFEKFGKTQADFDSLREETVAFGDLPTDEELRGEQENVQQAKEALATKVRKTISDIMKRVGDEFGTSSGTYKKFGVKGLSKQENEKLGYTARRVHRMATGLQAQLAARGLTVELLAEFAALREQYDKSVEAHEDAVGNRDIATETRTLAANALYAKVAELCGTGKSIWDGVSEAKYNDYIIYDTPSGGPEEDPAEEETSEE